MDLIAIKSVQTALEGIISKIAEQGGLCSVTVPLAGNEHPEIDLPGALSISVNHFQFMAVWILLSQAIPGLQVPSQPVPTFAKVK